MEPHSTWTGRLAGLMDSIIDDDGPSALNRMLFGFYQDGGCCALSDQEIGAHFPEGCALECNVAECADAAKIIASLQYLARLGPIHSSEPSTKILVDQLARAVSTKMRQKMGIDSGVPPSPSLVPTQRAPMKPDEPNRDVLGIDKLYKEAFLSEKITQEERDAKAKLPEPKEQAGIGWTIYRWVLIAIFLSLVWCGIETNTWWVVVGGLGCSLAMLGGKF